MLDAAAPMGLNSIIWQIQQMPPIMAASKYRMYFSGAKISINPETSKQFPIFNIKQRDAGLENPRPVRIELLQ